MFIPGGKRRKLTRQAELSEGIVADDGSFMLSAGQQVSQVAAMVSNHGPLLASGVTLEDM